MESADGSTEALNGGGTPIVCDTGRGSDSNSLPTTTIAANSIAPITRK